MDALDTLKDRTLALIGAHPALAAFCGALPKARRRDVAPSTLPSVSLLPDLVGACPEPTRPLGEALLAAAPLIEWRQTYSEAEVGREFLDRYAYCEILGPKGHFAWDRLRVFAAFWGEGLDYGMHAHEPEEIYVLLSGSAQFRTPLAHSRPGPGDHVVHAPGEPHAMRMDRAPLLALAIWRGAGLGDLPRLV